MCRKIVRVNERPIYMVSVRVWAYGLTTQQVAANPVLKIAYTSAGFTTETVIMIKKCI